MSNFKLDLMRMINPLIMHGSCMHHAGRLAELVLYTISQSWKDASVIKEKLIMLNNIRTRLDKKAKERFGTEDPFDF